MNNESSKINRSILPIPDPQYVGYTALDAKDPNIKFPPIGGSTKALSATTDLYAIVANVYALHLVPINPQRHRRARRRIAAPVRSDRVPDAARRADPGKTE